MQPMPSRRLWWHLRRKRRRSNNRRVYWFCMPNCQDATLSHVRSADNAHEVWKILGDMYEVRTMGQILALQKDLHNLSFAAFPSFSAFTSKMKDLRDDLANSGKTIASEDMAGLLLSKLSERFDDYFQSLVSSPRTSLVMWEEVIPAVAPPS